MNPLLTRRSDIPAMSLQGISAAYGSHLAIDNISLEIPTGGIVGLIGPNGAGKTTLLRAIVGSQPLLRGNVRVFGEPISKVRLRIAYVPQREQVDWSFPVTVLDVVLMGRYGLLGIGRRPRLADYDLAREALGLVDLAGLERRQISELSGGQQQRVFLARALAQQAELLLLDEPFTGIDATTQQLIFDLLENLRQQGRTVLLSTHDLHAVEQRCDALIAINRRLIAYGPTPQVFLPNILQATYGSRALTLDLHGEPLVIYDA